MLKCFWVEVMVPAAVVQPMAMAALVAVPPVRWPWHKLAVPVIDIPVVPLVLMTVRFSVFPVARRPVSVELVPVWRDFSERFHHRVGCAGGWREAASCAKLAD